MIINWLFYSDFTVTKILCFKIQIWWDQHFLEERTDAIVNAYKKLTNREIEISFEKEATYYNLKKGDRKWSSVINI